MYFRRYELALSTTILLLAALLRFVNIGAEPFFDDQARISVQALNLASRGDWEFVGPEMSIGGLRHSPLTNYLYAIPFSLSADPRIARLFTGMINLLAVAIVYLTGRRFFDLKAGLLAALLYAIYPAAVIGSRFMWNQNLAAPFVTFFILTGLMGYYGNHKAARVAHLPLLSLAGQCHPTLFLLFPVSIVCWFYAWCNLISARRQIFSQTALGGVLAVMLMLPWMVGTNQILSAMGPVNNITAGSAPSLREMAEIIYGVLAGVFAVYGGPLKDSPNLAQDNPNQPALAVLAIVAALWLVAGAWQRRDRFPGLVVVLGFFLVPALVIVLDINYWHHHIWPLVGSATLMQGAFLGGTAVPRFSDKQGSNIWRWRGLLNDRILRLPSLVLIGATCVHLLYLHITYDHTEGVQSLDQDLAALEDGLQAAKESGRELLLVALNDLQPRCAGCPGWEALHLIKDIPLRVIWDGYGLPLPSNGAILMGMMNYNGRPSVFAGGEIIHRWFRVVDLAPQDHFHPDLVGLDPVRFSNGTTVLGFLREIPGSLPTAGQSWTVFMIWRVDAPASGEYKVFTHLLDASGTVHGQHDPPGLPSDQWRVGEHVMSKLDLEADELLPSDGALYLRFGTYGDSGRVEVVNPSSNSAGTHGILQIRGARRSVHTWRDVLTLDELQTNTPLQQGSPLDITATWYAHRDVPVQTELRWRLRAPDGTLAFEGVTNLNPGAHSDTLPAGAFANAMYSIRIPSNIAPDDYQLSLSIIDRTGTSIGEPFTSTIRVLVRPRQFGTPAMQHIVGALFGEQIKLAGYDLEYDDGSLTLVLHWEALDHIGVDYKYFVHVLRGGEVVAQLDAMPDLYRYPTSWWAPGEVFGDLMTVDLSGIDSGGVNVEVGLYDPATGERLPITNRASTVVLNGSLHLAEVIVP